MSERDIFIAALEADDPAEQARILDQACGRNLTLRRQIEGLLANHLRQAKFILDSPPEELDATVNLEIAEKSGTVIGPYKLLQPIGEGGMGVVFMAEQTTPIHRTVALKIIKPGMDSGQVIARFEAERQALAMMDHPNIAKVLDAGTTASGRPYFVMELVKGVPITRYCDDKHLSVRERLALMIPVCQAVQHAHQKGIIHRDLKPSNVLIAEYDFHASPKVIDFGVAKATSQKLTERTMFTEFGQIVGTFEYMSPEQAKLNQLDIDTRSDIYSLGVLLYELLAGTTPFERKRLREAAFDEVLRIIREEEPPKPSTRLSTAAELPSIAANRGLEPKKLSGQLKGELDWVVMKALEKDRNRRYETANGLALDVQRFLAGEPVLAHPPSKRYRLAKFVRKHRAPMVVVALILLALVGGVFGTTLGMLRAGRAETRALKQRDDAISARKEVFDVLTDLTDNTVGELLAQNANIDSAQRTFLERVIARYERLAVNLADASGGEKMRAECLAQVGRTYLLLGDNKHAEETLLQAIAILRSLNSQSPDDPEPASELMNCLNLLGVAYERMEQNSNRDDVMDEALTLGEVSHDRFPQHSGIAASLAVFYSNRAARNWSDSEGRLADINRTIDIAKVLVDRDGEDPVFRRTLAVGYMRKARHFGALNDVDTTRSAVEQVEALIAGIGLDGKLLLAESYTALGGALLRTAQQEAAIAAHRVAEQLMEELAADRPGDAKVAMELATCLETLERILRNAGRIDEANAYLQRAKALSERRIARSGGDLGSLGNFIDLTAATARSYLDSGRYEQAEATVDELITAGKRLLAARPQSALGDGEAARTDARRQAHRFRQLADLSNLVRRYEDAVFFARHQLEFARASAPPGERPNEELFVLLESGNWSLVVALEASGRLQEARPYWEELVRITAWTSPRFVREEACRFIVEIGEKLALLGAPEDPKEVLAQGFADRSAQLVANPKDDVVRSELWRGYRALGLILEFHKRFSEAIEANEQGIAIKPLAAGPGAMTPEDREVYSLLLLGRAVCLDALGRETDAEAAYAASREFSGSQHDNWIFENRAATMARNGQWKWAIRLADSFLADSGGGARQYYNAACIYALASAAGDVPPERKDALARRAIELLTESKNAGWFRDPVQTQNAKKDKDLDSLRDRDDFQKLLSELDSDPINAK